MNHRNYNYGESVLYKSDRHVPVLHSNYTGYFINKKIYICDRRRTTYISIDYHGNIIKEDKPDSEWRINYNGLLEIFKYNRLYIVVYNTNDNTLHAYHNDAYMRLDLSKYKNQFEFEGDENMKIIDTNLYIELNEYGSISISNNSYNALTYDINYNYLFNHFVKQDGYKIKLSIDEDKLTKLDKDDEMITENLSEYKIDDITNLHINGINFGDLFHQEYWSGSYSPTNNDYTYNHFLDKLYSKLNGIEVLNYIGDRIKFNLQDDDLKDIRNHGFNCIRIALYYGLLFTGDEELYNWNKLLDKIFQLAYDNSLYILLTCQCGYDTFNGDTVSGIEKHNENDTLSGGFENAENMKRLCNFWKHIARRYKNETTLIGYDILNEPNLKYHSNNFNYKMILAYDQIYNAIREVDNNHIIIFESEFVYSLPMYYRDAGLMFKNNIGEIKLNWNNFAYSYHIYNKSSEYSSLFQINSVKNLLKHILRLRKKNYDTHQYIPVLIGELNFGFNPISWKEIIKIFTKFDIGWFMYCYKARKSAMHYALRHTNNMFMINPDANSSTIRAAMKNDIRSIKYEETTLNHTMSVTLISSLQYKYSDSLKLSYTGGNKSLNNYSSTQINDNMKFLSLLFLLLVIVVIVVIVVILYSMNMSSEKTMKK